MFHQDKWQTDRFHLEWNVATTSHQLNGDRFGTINKCRVAAPKKRRKVEPFVKWSDVVTDADILWR